MEIVDIYTDILEPNHLTTLNGLKQLICNNNIKSLNDIIKNLTHNNEISGDNLTFLKIIFHLIGQEIVSLNDVKAYIDRVKNDANGLNTLKELYMMSLIFSTGDYKYGLPSNVDDGYFPQWVGQQVQVENVLPLISRVYTQSSKVLFTEAPGVEPQSAYKDSANITQSISEIYSTTLYEMYMMSSIKMGDTVPKDYKGSLNGLKNYIVDTMKSYFPEFIENNSINFLQFIIIDDVFPEKMQKYLPKINLVINYMPGQRSSFTDKYNEVKEYKGSNINLLQIPYLEIENSEYKYSTEIFKTHTAAEISVSKYSFFKNLPESIDSPENILVNLRTFFILFFKRISEGTINYKIL